MTRDIVLPDGTVRHNVGSDNLSDEDRQSMDRELEEWVWREGAFTQTQEAQIAKYRDKLEAEILSLHRQLAEANLRAYQGWMRYETAKEMYISLMEEKLNIAK